jgi:hypothetical protein
VIIPWASGNPCPHRAAALGWAAGRWVGAGYDVVLGTTTGPWCKAAAVADGLTRADGGIVVVADADCWSDGIAAAVDSVASGASWAMPHRRVHRLTHAATRRVLDGAEPDARMDVVQPPYAGWAGGGIVVVRREVYEQAPLDPRFVGWSGEDESWAHALTCLAGAAWRGVAPLWHLWHPPQERLSRRWGSQAARALASRYRSAAHEPSAMRDLIAEASARC